MATTTHYGVTNSPRPDLQHTFSRWVAASAVAKVHWYRALVFAIDTLGRIDSLSHDQLLSAKLAFEAYETSFDTGEERVRTLESADRDLIIQAVLDPSTDFKTGEIGARFSNIEPSRAAVYPKDWKIEPYRQCVEYWRSFAYAHGWDQPLPKELPEPASQFSVQCMDLDMETDVPDAANVLEPHRVIKRALVDLKSHKTGDHKRMGRRARQTHARMRYAYAKYAALLCRELAATGTLQKQQKLSRDNHIAWWEFKASNLLYIGASRDEPLLTSLEYEGLRLHKEYMKLVTDAEKLSRQCKDKPALISSAKWWESRQDLYAQIEHYTQNELAGRPMPLRQISLAIDPTLANS